MPGAFVHGKGTIIKVNATDLSAYCKTSEIKDGADKHDITGYGAGGHGYGGGLRDATISLSGTYFSGTTGPRGVLRPLIGQNAVTFIRQSEGTGTGKPQDSATVFVESYVETNPVADYIQWSAELSVCGVINDAAQP